MPVPQRSMRRTFTLSLIGTCVLAGCSKTSLWVRRGDADQGADGSNQSVHGIARLSDSDASTSAAENGGDESSGVQFASITKPVIHHSLKTLNPGEKIRCYNSECVGRSARGFFRRMVWTLQKAVCHSACS